jgi:aldehyde:ferredoxin oxidoreductase
VGKILEVDLENESFEKLKLNSKWVGLYVRGGGYATRILYDFIDKNIDPLSRENPLIFMAGPLTGLVATSPKIQRSNREKRGQGHNIKDWR